MPTLTRTQLIADIKLEARITGTELDTMIDGILSGVVEDCFFKERCFELRVVNAVLANPTVSTGIIALPAAFQHIDQVRYATSASALTSITAKPLFPKTDFVNYVSIGIPKWFEIQGTNIYVFPYSLVATTHRVYIDYYSKPTFTSGSDSFPVLRLQESVKKEAIARLHLWHKQRDDAGVMMSLTDRSRAAGNAANPEQREVAPVDTRKPDYHTTPSGAKGGE